MGTMGSNIFTLSLLGFLKTYPYVKLFRMHENNILTVIWDYMLNIFDSI